MNDNIVLESRVLSYELLQAILNQLEDTSVTKEQLLSHLWGGIQRCIIIRTETQKLNDRLNQLEKEHTEGKALLIAELNEYRKNCQHHFKEFPNFKECTVCGLLSGKVKA